MARSLRLAMVMVTIPNLVTVDLDEPREPSAGGLEGITDALLDAFEGANTTATFFVPLSVARGKPQLARRLAERGHELACLSSAKPSNSKPYCVTVCGELETTKKAIEDATGSRVRGHRNAAFAVDYGSEWVYDVLVDRGFEYDSSRFPTRYVEYGYQPVPRTVHAVRRWGGTLLEVPVSTTDLLSIRVQIGSAGTLRGLPLPVWSAVVEQRQARGEPLVVHLRASELRRSWSLTRKTAADRRTLNRVAGLAQRYSFSSVSRALPELLRLAPIIEC